MDLGCTIHSTCHTKRRLNVQMSPRPSVFNTFDFEMCFAPQRRALFRHLNFQKCSETASFTHFWLRNVLRATTPCTFSTSQLPKVFRDRQFLTLFTSKCALRHFFVISTSKTAPNPSVFKTFYFQMCFAPQRRALFQHLNFQKWSDAEVFCTFSLRNRHNGVQLFISRLPRCLRTRRFSEPTFRPSGATKPRKKAMFRDFPTFSRTCIFFLLIFSLLTLLPADCFFISPYCRKFDF